MNEKRHPGYTPESHDLDWHRATVCTEIDLGQEAVGQAARHLIYAGRHKCTPGTPEYREIGMAYQLVKEAADKLATAWELVYTLGKEE